VTRAEPGAARTAGRLAALGFAPVVAPVLEIRPVAAPEPDLRGIGALAFTSPNGVEAFARLTPRRDQPVFAVGDVTAAAARAAGWDDVVSASGAIGDLERLLADRAAGPVLAPGAREPAGDLAGRLAGRIEVRRLPVYEAVETAAPAPTDWDVVLVHSPRAARAIVAALGAAGAGGRAAVAISARAAAPLAPCGFDRLDVAAAPAEAAMLEALGNPGGDV
jgi:uroporphyrinogen-III synthase